MLAHRGKLVSALSSSKKVEDLEQVQHSKKETAFSMMIQILKIVTLTTTKCTSGNKENKLIAKHRNL